MHFERLRFDRERCEVLEDSVGDDVFSGATVQWRGFSRGDREWLFEQLDGVLRIWVPTSEANVWSLTGHVDDAGPRYTLTCEVSGEPVPAAWDALDEVQRREILEHLEIALESVHALLLIY